MTDEMTPRTEAEGRSLDRVQRVLISVLIFFVMGILSVALNIYIVLSGDNMAHSDAVGLWILSGVIGLLSSGMTVMINRLRPYNPLVLIGLIPMAVFAFWVL